MYGFQVTILGPEGSNQSLLGNLLLGGFILESQHTVSFV
ncbi:hypothetical protein VCHA29O37_50001 [Vibrio chagasii]|nr:hypothetical protein VCHA29O37_50001 [Vibrio chagasii]